MIIHTLGPESTDSFGALLSIVESSKKIVCHKSFDDIIENLHLFVDEYIFLPTAYQSHKRDYGWKDFNFQYWNQIELMTVFARPTKPMVLLKNKRWESDKAIIHPATKIFIEKYLNRMGEHTTMMFAKSKFSAWEIFKRDSLKYTIISLENFKDKDYPNYSIIEEYTPQMIWCLYKVRGESVD